MTINPDDVAKAKWDATAGAREVLEHLHRALLAVPAFTLKDGTAARVEDYWAPEIGDDGELSCGVDVVVGEGGHLEFTVRNTGWGKSFVGDLSRGNDKGPRRR